MKGLLLQNKKGVSEIVGYVLLIVIAVGISALVYSFLKLYIPKDTAKCSEDISIIVQNYSCSAGKLELVLQNKGLFSIHGAYIRFGEPGQKVKLVNLNNISVKGKDYNCILFSDLQCSSLGQLILDGKGLRPGDSLSRTFTQGIASGSKELEIEPVELLNNKQVLCKDAVINQPIVCT